MTFPLNTRRPACHETARIQNRVESLRKSRRRQSNTDHSVSSTDSSSVSSYGGMSTFSDRSTRSDKKKSQPKYAVEFNPTHPIPLTAITYEMVLKVMDTWEQLRCIPKWEATAGEMFVRKIFELDPETITMFGFAADTKYDDPALSDDAAFMAKSTRLLKAIDVAVGCLGPDLSPLEQQLLDLGARHTAMNCRPHHWPIVGEALMYVLGSFLGDRLGKEQRESWTVIYNFLSFHMVRGLLQSKPILAGRALLPEESKTHVLTTPAPVVVRRSPTGSSITHPGSNPTSTIRSKKNDHHQSTEKVSSVTLDCTKAVSVDEMTFNVVTDVLTSWERGIKAIPNWSAKTGVLFLRYILKHTGSEGIKLFGLPLDVQWDDPRLDVDTVVQTKGGRLIQAIDMALSFLGPDLSPLEVTLKDLGRRHYHMNCQPEHWPLVGKALFDVFRDCMGNDGVLFTIEVEESWTMLYNFLGFYMIEGLNAEKNGE